MTPLPVETPSEKITLAMTGASGAQYGLRLLECLLAANREVYFLASKAVKVVLAEEMNLHIGNTEAETEQFLTDRYRAKPGQIRVFGEDDWMSPVASGSGAPKQMVLCPCSMGTLSAVACGLSNNLAQRAASVVLKERGKLIVVPRESPYSEIHLENMLKLTRMGSVILPASPGFYNQPQSVNDLIDFIVARIMDQLGIEQTLMPQWGVAS
ncbi:flavin prenyltransferase UbiX [Endozoicomonas ascidiicola]|uniref:flavin prenyltransferase UbiX n=1 Tax=Endozoicomonas ascidiicola TaxID=1698521 RepID=UPI000834C309|nr:flavin prenyltransferase UbiX [Endozoicomonas ascidiicola]